MSLGRVGKKLLVLAMSFASWGSLRAEVSPNLHIVANAVENATKKLKGGFTTKLFRSAQAIGHELVQIVTHPTTRLAVKPATLKKRVARTRAQELFTKIQAKNDHNRHWTQQNRQILSVTRVSFRKLNPNAGKNGDTGLIPQSEINKIERFFPQCLLLPGMSCSLRAENVITITRDWPMRRFNRVFTSAVRAPLSHREFKTVRSTTVQPALSLKARAFAAITSSTHIFVAPPTMCFSIDRAGRAACVTHGTVGARIALYSDRSRNNRA